MATIQGLIDQMVEDKKRHQAYISTNDLRQYVQWNWTAGESCALLKELGFKALGTLNRHKALHVDSKCVTGGDNLHCIHSMNDTEQCCACEKVWNVLSLQVAKQIDEETGLFDL